MFFLRFEQRRHMPTVIEALHHPRDAIAYGRDSPKNARQCRTGSQ